MVQYVLNFAPFAQKYYLMWFSFSRGDFCLCYFNKKMVNE